MVEHLDLSLLRHQYCWLSQRLLENREKLLSLIPNTGGMGERHVDLLELIIFVTSEYERIRKKSDQLSTQLIFERMGRYTHLAKLLLH